MHLITPLLAIILLAMTFPALSAPDGLRDVGQHSMLDARQAFRVTVAQAPGGPMEVRIAIAPGYYLYRDKIRIQASGAQVGEFDLPAAQLLDAPGFGREAVYSGALVLPLPNLQIPAGTEATLYVRTQGCHVDAGVCYPPTSQTFVIRRSHLLPGRGA